MTGIEQEIANDVASRLEYGLPARRVEQLRSWARIERHIAKCWLDEYGRNNPTIAQVVREALTNLTKEMLVKDINV